MDVIWISERAAKKNVSCPRALPLIFTIPFSSSEGMIRCDRLKILRASKLRASSCLRLTSPSSLNPPDPAHYHGSPRLPRPTQGSGRSEHMDENRNQRRDILLASNYSQYRRLISSILLSLGYPVAFDAPFQEVKPECYRFEGKKSLQGQT